MNLNGDLYWSRYPVESQVSDRWQLRRSKSSSSAVSSSIARHCSSDLYVTWLYLVCFDRFHESKDFRNLYSAYGNIPPYIQLKENIIFLSGHSCFFVVQLFPHNPKRNGRIHGCSLKVETSSQHVPKLQLPTLRHGRLGQHRPPGLSKPCQNLACVPVKMMSWDVMGIWGYEGDGEEQSRRTPHVFSPPAMM